MLEARLEQAALLKKLLDSIKELVTDANFECDEEGIKLQAMDNSHVALVAVRLDSEGFIKYRCDRPMPLGVNLNSLAKVLKCAKDDDTVTIKAGDNNDVLNLLYESPSTDRIAEYEMKLMDIDADQLGIPDTDYEASVTMSSSEFGRIVRDLNNLGESVKIEVTKEGVRFTSEGDAANGSVLLKPTDNNTSKKTPKSGEGSSSKKKEKGKANGVEKKPKVKTEDGGDGDEQMNEPDVITGDDDGEEEKNDDDDEHKPDAEEVEEEEEEEENEEEEEESASKKRKRKGKESDKSNKKTKKDEDKEADGVTIAMSQPVNLTFSLKYLINFTKSSSLSRTVQLQLSNDVPLLVSYPFGPGSISYYLAPKIGEE